MELITAVYMSKAGLHWQICGPDILALHKKGIKKKKCRTVLPDIEPIFFFKGASRYRTKFVRLKAIL